MLTILFVFVSLPFLTHTVSLPFLSHTVPLSVSLCLFVSLCLSLSLSVSRSLSVSLSVSLLSPLLRYWSNNFFFQQCKNVRSNSMQLYNCNIYCSFSCCFRVWLLDLLLKICYIPCLKKRKQIDRRKGSIYGKFVVVSNSKLRNGAFPVSGARSQNASKLASLTEIRLELACSYYSPTPMPRISLNSKF